MGWQRTLCDQTPSPGRTSVEEISMIVAVRLHDGNPWILERLEMLGDHYDPRPQIVIVDFGSQGAHRHAIAERAARLGFELVYEPDTGVFCLARARNLGASAASGAFLFFSDIDCFGERDLFRRMVQVFDAGGMRGHVDTMLNLPVYHLDGEATREVQSQPGAVERSAALLRAFVQGVVAEAGNGVEYVDSCSNFFLCHKRFYDLVGGYNESFRGHGSEDFEFLLRFRAHSWQLPLPELPLRNTYRPRREGAYGVKRYRGFRRLGELFAVQAETAGLRIAHLHHPRAREGDSWYEQGDLDKTKLREQARPFLDVPAMLLRYDWMPRARTALTVLHGPQDWALLMPLRLLGFRLEPLDVNRKGWKGVLDGLERAEAGSVVVAVSRKGTRDELSRMLGKARHVGVDAYVLWPTAEEGRYVWAAEAPVDQADSSEHSVARVLQSADALFDRPAPWGDTERPPLCIKLPSRTGPAALLYRAALVPGDISRSYAAAKTAVGAMRAEQGEK